MIVHTSSTALQSALLLCQLHHSTPFDAIKSINKSVQCLSIFREHFVLCSINRNVRCQFTEHRRHRHRHRHRRHWSTDDQPSLITETRKTLTPTSLKHRSSTIADHWITEDTDTDVTEALTHQCTDFYWHIRPVCISIGRYTRCVSASVISVSVSSVLRGPVIVDHRCSSDVGVSVFSVSVISNGWSPVLQWRRCQCSQYLHWHRTSLSIKHATLKMKAFVFTHERTSPSVTRRSRSYFGHK